MPTHPHPLSLLAIFLSTLCAPTFAPAAELKPDQPDSIPDKIRRAINEAGGRVVFENSSQSKVAVEFSQRQPSPKVFADLQKIPNLCSLKCQGIQLGPDCIAQIANLPTLTELGLANCSMPKGSLKNLATLKDLEAIDITGLEVSRSDLLALGTISTLQGLVMSGAQLDKDSLSALAAMNHLRSLSLTCSSLADRDVHYIVKLEKLQALAIRSPLLTDRGVNELGALRELRELTLAGTQVTDNGVLVVRKFPHLRILRIWGASLKDGTGILAVSACANLTDLELVGAHLGDKDLLALQSLKSLEKLDLTANDVGNTVADLLHLLPKLRAVALRGTKITDEGIKAMARQIGLQSLDLRQTEITPGMAEQLQKALPNAEILTSRPRG